MYNAQTATSVYSALRGMGALDIDLDKIAKSTAAATVNALKPRIPELVDAAMPNILNAVKRETPSLLNRALPAVDAYVKNVLYPKTVAPILDTEVNRVIGKVRNVALISAGMIGSALIASALIRRRKAST